MCYFEVRNICKNKLFINIKIFQRKIKFTACDNRKFEGFQTKYIRLHLISRTPYFIENSFSFMLDTFTLNLMHRNNIDFR